MTHSNVVVIGASAGGIEALKVLIAGLPERFPAAVLVALHISPHLPSQLDAVLRPTSRLPVKSAEDGEFVLAGHIYVASADRHLLMDSNGRRLRVTRGPKENRVRPAIDVLFRSAAYWLGPDVVGVVLSGNLDDGTAGLWAIKDRGGIAIVQSPEDAMYASMPESALRHVAVDHTLPVAEMPDLLVRLAQSPIRSGAVRSAGDVMKTEVTIALEGNALQEGVMQLGAISANTCPECHGVLVRIREGSLIRYRCHTGHAFSLETLLVEVNEEIDQTLWAALRALEERILLLRELEEAAGTRGDDVAAARYAGEGNGTAERAQRIREMVLAHKPLDPALEAEESELTDGSPPARAAGGQR